jgi:hypothetical protein
MNAQRAVLAAGILSACLLVGCAAEKNVYVVQSEDQSFRDVAARVYPGQPADEVADEIREANPKVSEDDLKPGVQLVVPEVKDEMGSPIEPKECNRAKVYY